jgi:hypothetical protein
MLKQDDLLYFLDWAEKELPTISFDYCANEIKTRPHRWESNKNIKQGCVCSSAVILSFHKSDDDIAYTEDDESDDNCEEFWMYWNSHNVNDDNRSDAGDEGYEGELISYYIFKY